MPRLLSLPGLEDLPPTKLELLHALEPPPLGSTERYFQERVIWLGRVCNWRHYHTHTSTFSPSGFPDLVLVRPPRLLLIELKAGKKEPFPAQRDWLEMLAACPGVETYLWRPSTWEEVKRVLA